MCSSVDGAANTPGGKLPFPGHSVTRRLRSRMVVYSNEQRVFIVRTYWVTNSLKRCQSEFRKKYGVRDVPAKSVIQKMVRKLETTGSLIPCHGGGRPTLSQDTIDDVELRLQRSPTKSLRRLAQETGRSYSTCQRAAKRANLHAYRVTAVQELKASDLEKRIRYCHWFQAFVRNNEGILDITWFSDEAWFHLSGFVNSQNTRIWAAENPFATHQTPLHDQKVGVWCAMSRLRIIGPIFFDTTVNTDVYLNIFEQFVNQLDDRELTAGYFQQDGATCHTSARSMAEIESFFGTRVISKGLWPARSPDLTPPDFFLWGMLKGRVYRNKPRTVEDLKENIQREIAAIPPDILATTIRNMERRVEMCLAENGDHFQHRM